MLLGFFRINDPYRLLGLLIIIILISLPHWIAPAGMLLSELKYAVLGEAFANGKGLYTQLFDDTPPLAGTLFGFKDMLFGRSEIAGQVIALIIIFFQSGYFAILLINNKAYTENTYLPALIFGLLSFVSFDIVSLSPELLASTVLLFALNKLFHEIEFKMQRDDIVLKLGVYLGLATFLVFSYWIFLIITIVILVLFTRPGFRKIALLLLGFALPHAILWSIYFYTDQTQLLWQNFYAKNITLTGEQLLSTKGIFVLCGVPIGYFVFSVFMMNREARFTKYQSQLMQIMFLWILTSLAHVFMVRVFTSASLLTFIPPLAYFISHYLLLIRRRWRAETMLWIFIIGIVSVNYLSRFGKIESINYSSLFPGPVVHPQLAGEHVMNLGPELNVYKNNRLGGFFLNWELAEPVFEDFSTYENVEIVARCFQEDPPTVIIDENNFFEKVLERIPYLKSHYKKEGVYYRRVSN